MTKPRILLAEDHPDMLRALCALLLEDELGEIVGTVADGESLVAAAQRLKPDVIITDISMPRLNGLDVTHALQVCVPQSKVIILTVHQEPVYMTLAFQAGARGFLLKRAGLHSELSQALVHVLAGDRYFGLGVREEWAPVDGAKAPIKMSE